MKRLLLTIVLFCSIIIAKAAVIIWDGGGGDGLWNTAVNWVGDVVPGAADDVILDNSALAGTYTVTLPGGAVTVAINSITITPLVANNITLILPNTNTANPGFSVTGTGDALILNIRAILINSSAAAAGSGISITNTFRINNGGHYVHKTGGGNAAIISQLSPVAGTELGEFEFDDPTGSTIISLSGRTFGTLTLSAVANSGIASYIGSGAVTCNVNGNLNINTGVSFAISMSADFVVKQNYNQAGSSTFNIQSSTNSNNIKVAGNVSTGGTITESNTGLPTFELNGTTNQQISGMGSLQNSITFLMNNPAGATLNSPLTLPYNLTLTSGKITTTSVNLLMMIDNATYTGGSAISFVNGPMKKTGNDNFIFPVGVGSIYAPIGIVNVSGETITDEFTAEYKRTNPQSIHGTATQTGQDHVSFVEYWTLSQVAGTAIKKISLAVNTTSFCKVLANTYISRWNGSLWTNEGSVNGGVTPAPPFETGTITSVSNLTAFGDFTLITDLPFAVNPLPIDLISFNAIKNNTTAAISWELSACCSKEAIFELQKSADNRFFSTLIRVSGSETNRFYSANDNRLVKGINYYRLKMIDADGKASYSKTIAIIYESKDILITSVAPNPVHTAAIITVSSARQGGVNFTIYDMGGREVKRWHSGINEGNTTLTMDISNLSNGIYQLLASTIESKTVFRFIKQ